jgi:hypothetical protein
MVGLFVSSKLFMAALALVTLASIDETERVEDAILDGC